MNDLSANVRVFGKDSQFFKSVADFKLFLDMNWDASHHVSGLHLRIVDDADHTLVVDEAVIQRRIGANGRKQWYIQRPGSRSMKLWGIVTWFAATRELLNEGKVLQLAIGNFEFTIERDRRNRNVPDANSVTGELLKSQQARLTSKNITL